jgi:hypothetical protein
MRPAVLMMLAMHCNASSVSLQCSQCQRCVSLNAAWHADGVGGQQVMLPAQHAVLIIINIMFMALLLPSQAVVTAVAIATAPSALLMTLATCVLGHGFSTGVLWSWAGSRCPACR